MSRRPLSGNLQHMKRNETTATENRDYYTIPEAARILDVSVATVSRWIAAGRLEAYRVGPRTIRIRKDQLQSLITPAGDTRMTDKPQPITITSPSPAELARRKAVVDATLERRKDRNIAPLTSTDLVHMARAELMRRGR